MSDEITESVMTEPVIIEPVKPQPVKTKPVKVAPEPVKKMFRVKKIFAEWVLPLEVSLEDTNETLLAKAMYEINNRRLVSLHPENDHVLEEVT